MPKSSRARKRRSPVRRSTLARDPRAFPILIVLIVAVVVLGVFNYTLSVALASAAVVGFFAWRWWQGAAKK
jgi:hypothetical protein